MGLMMSIIIIMIRIIINVIGVVTSVFAIRHFQNEVFNNKLSERVLKLFLLYAVISLIFSFFLAYISSL